MNFKIFKSAERGVKNLGWLVSNFSFSFSNYYNPEKNGFGLLKVFNDDFVEAGKGFGIHPHSNMEIISIMLQGKMNHKDTLGYSEVVERDWVQIMSAGTGLRHEEYNIGEEEVRFLQIWVEPKLQNINPRYQKRYFPEEKRKNTLKTIVSNEEGQEHCWINQNAKLSLGYFDPGQATSYTLNPLNKIVYIFNIEGELSVEGHKIEPGDAIGLWATDRVQIENITSSKYLLIEAPINH
ncbi:pirin family protein [Desertivirga brevis]|uniref:pirin family protein n=1 Tax=Desertivirga brevis TaxID=2810310 RepID=UPI001A9676A5|nr:pirin family protein [Pedobacter sp. SYSU D00873]